jgi:hypothetical protein
VKGAETREMQEVLRKDRLLKDAKARELQVVV